MWIEIVEQTVIPIHSYVTSLAEVWIEIESCGHQFRSRRVTSLAEVWIEILYYILK